MTKRIIKSVIYFVLLGCINNQVCFADATKKCSGNECYIQLAKSAQSENSFIKKNQDAVKSSTNVALYTVYRIKCLNTSGQNGLIACNKALSVKPNDASLRKRRSALSAQLRPKPRVVIRRAPPPVVRKPPPPRPKAAQIRTPPVASKPRQTPKKNRINQATLDKENIARKQRKETIIKIQKQLINLGFKISVADGVAGKNTRKAINNFLEISHSKVSSKTNKTLLAELRSAYKVHLKSNKGLELAKSQKEDGDLTKALETIAINLELAPWNNSLKALKHQVTSQIEGSQKLAQEKANNVISLKDIEIQKELQKQQELSKADEQQRNNSIIAKAKGELLANNFATSLLSINEGLQRSPQNKDMLELKEKILSTQKKYRRNEEVRSIVNNAQDMVVNKEFQKATLLITKGLSIDPDNQSLLTIKNNLDLKKEQKEKLSTLLFESKKLLAENNFEDAIKLTRRGLLLEPNHADLLDINKKAVEEKEKVIIRISVRKQKTFNYLTLMEGKQKELHDIEKSIASEKNLLLIKAQETLKKYWVTQ